MSSRLLSDGDPFVEANPRHITPCSAVPNCAVGWTPLLYAVNQNSNQALKALLACRRVDVFLRIVGLSALDMAYQKKSKGCLAADIAIKAIEDRILSTMAPVTSRKKRHRDDQDVDGPEMKRRALNAEATITILRSRYRNEQRINLAHTQKNTAA